MRTCFAFDSLMLCGIVHSRLASERRAIRVNSFGQNINGQYLQCRIYILWLIGGHDWYSFALVTLQCHRNETADWRTLSLLR